MVGSRSGSCQITHRLAVPPAACRLLIPAHGSRGCSSYPTFTFTGVPRYQGGTPYSVLSQVVPLYTVSDRPQVGALSCWLEKSMGQGKGKDLTRNPTTLLAFCPALLRRSHFDTGICRRRCGGR